MMSPVATRTGVLDATALLTELLTIPSATGGEAAAVALLTSRLAGAGFDATIDEAGSCVAQWGDGPVDVVLVGHIDTVPGTIMVRREGTLLFGRGAVDAKGPLVAAICAVSRQPWSGRHRYTVVAAVDEEGDSRGARALLGRTAPDHLIVLEPSGWDAVTIGYKGCIRIRLRVDQPVHHGASGSPSAADRIVGVITALRGRADRHNQGQRIFDQIDVRVTDLASGGDGLEEWCRASVAIRIPVGVPAGDVVTQLALWCGDHVTLAVDWRCEAVRRPRSTHLASAFVRAIRNGGGTPRFKVKTGTADMNILAPAWGCPAVAYGPGDSHLDHTPDECIDVVELEQGVAVLTAVLAEL